MHRGGVDLRRARRWFWTLLVVAVLAMGVLYRAVQSEPGVDAGVAILLSSLVLLAATGQAARISSVLVGQPSRSRRGGNGAGSGAGPADRDEPGVLESRRRGRSRRTSAPIA